MFVVGLTGGISTGKSTVAKMFQELGAVLIDADRIARQLVEPHQPTWEKIVAHFGPKVVQTDGQVKRKFLASQIFGSDDKRWALNAIVHPPVVAEIERQLKKLAATQPQAIVIADIPLLFEVEWPFEWDKIIVVFAEEIKQFERLQAKERKFNKLKFKQRLRSQLPLAEKVKRADWVIENNGSLERTQEQVVKIFRQLNIACSCNFD